MAYKVHRLQVDSIRYAVIHMSLYENRYYAIFVSNLSLGDLFSGILVQPALVIADLQGCPAEAVITEFHNIQGPVQLCFKIPLKLITFRVHICSILLHVNTSRYILHIQQHVSHIHISAVLFLLNKSIKLISFVKLDK